MSEKTESKDDNERIDWDAYRTLSLQPGGFGESRPEIWPRLLHAHSNASPAPTTPSDHQDALLESSYLQANEKPQHRDERQIGLDTDRSFVLYPVGEPSPSPPPSLPLNKGASEDAENRAPLQARLHALIVAVFRRRPLLNYYQGYHDIISVLFLTLPEEVQLVCAEKMSLHRLRDSMGLSLEPVVGLLRVLKRLLHLADPSFAELLEETAPLPYFALSNILTLLSHDIPTLPLIQHVFDYLLCRPPICIVYLVAAIALSRRDDARKQELEGEDGMVHSLLSSLPNLCEEKTEDFSDLQDVDDVKANASEPETATPAPSEDSSSLQESELESLEDVDESVTTVEVPDEMTKSEEWDHSIPSIDSALSLAQEPPDALADSVSSYHTSRAKLEDSTLSESSKPDSPPSPSPAPPELSAMTLSSLLKHADELYLLYPPSHPSIALGSIMGPQSVVFTWSEDAAALPADDAAERMVARPELVVLPVIEPEDEVVSDEDHDEKHARRRPRRPHTLGALSLERKTMVAGAVLVLGVAIAVYSLNSAGNGARAGEHGLGREWRKVGRLLAGALIGVGEHVFGDLWH